MVRAPFQPLVTPGDVALMYNLDADTIRYEVISMLLAARDTVRSCLTDVINSLTMQTCLNYNADCNSAHLRALLPVHTSRGYGTPPPGDHQRVQQGWDPHPRTNTKFSLL